MKYCPICGAEMKTRERRPNGNDTCTAGHTYPSASAVERPKKNDIYNPDPRSWTGSRHIDLLDPNPADFVWSEIATSLARTFRYGGFSDLPVSVAQHLLIGDYIIRDTAVWADVRRQLRRVWLIHDAAEAYLGDDQRPLKRIPQMAWKGELEALYDTRLRQRFKVHPDDKVSAAVKMVDNLSLATEVEVAMPAVKEEWSSLPEAPARAVAFARKLLTHTGRIDYAAARVMDIAEEIGIR